MLKFWNVTVYYLILTLNFAGSLLSLDDIALTLAVSVSRFTLRWILMEI